MTGVPLWEPVTLDPTLVAMFFRATGMPGQTETLAGQRPLPASALAILRPDVSGLGIPDDEATKLNAGNRYTILSDIYAGETPERSSRIADVEEKRGRSGRLIFYTVESLFRRCGRPELVARTQGMALRRYQDA